MEGGKAFQSFMAPTASTCLLALAWACGFLSFFGWPLVDDIEEGSKNSSALALMPPPPPVAQSGERLTAEPTGSESPVGALPICS